MQSETFKDREKASIEKKKSKIKEKQCKERRKREVGQKGKRSKEN